MTRLSVHKRESIHLSGIKGVCAPPSVDGEGGGCV